MPGSIHPQPPPRKVTQSSRRDWRAAREEMERGRYEDIELRRVAGEITFAEAVALKSKVPDEVRELVRHAIAVHERGE